MAFRETKVLYGDENIVEHAELHLTIGEVMGLAETLTTILANHRDDDIGIVTLELDTNGGATAVVILREWDETDLDGGGYRLPLARYEVPLAGSDELKHIDLRPLRDTPLRHENG